MRSAEIIARELIGMARQGATAPDLACALVAEFEGFSATCYTCPAGVPTQGFGTTRRPDGRPVLMGDPPCTRAEATAWLLRDLAGAFNSLDRLVADAPLLSAGKRAALASFIYNLGAGAFERSTLRKHLIGKRYPLAANEILKWNRAGGQVLAGLVKRRRAERWLFVGEIDAEPV